MFFFCINAGRSSTFWGSINAHAKKQWTIPLWVTWLSSLPLFITHAEQQQVVHAQNSQQQQIINHDSVIYVFPLTSANGSLKNDVFLNGFFCNVNEPTCSVD